MRLTRTQKSVLLISLLNSIPEDAPMDAARVVAVHDWLSTNLPDSHPDDLALVESELPPAGPGESYGALRIQPHDFADALMQVLEAIMASPMLPEEGGVQ